MPIPTLDELELALQSPRATGIFLVEVRPGSPAHGAGFAPGDIVTAIGGAATPDLTSFLKALQSAGKAPVVVNATRPDGSPFTATIPSAPIGVQGYAVRFATCAWRAEPDCPDSPDFSAFEKDASWWLRSSFGTERAGYERIHVKRRGDRVEFDHHTHIGGGQGAQKWTYRTHVLSTHRLDAILSTTAMEQITGTPAEGQEKTRLALGLDGSWRGESIDSKGAKKSIEERPSVAAALNTYSIPLLALTMPFRSGARRAFPEVRESSGQIRSRSRLECLGREEVAVNGKKIPAWCFAWRHWGEGANFERFWVSDHRCLVRIEWGPDYAGCWCEAVTEAEAGKGLPGHIRVE
ncbi:MAG: PDZ domain-containing protein [Planctomycetes bacterium]|nr:PDZ domain-containing protein [Planctomycetota bacterium]